MKNIPYQKMKMLAASVLLPIFLFSSCIKEDRTGCPCFLTVDYSKVDTARFDRLLLFIMDEKDRIISADTVEKDRFSRKESMKVKKGRMKMAIWGNVKEHTLLDTAGRMLSGTAGSGCDSLYLFSDRIDTRHESSFKIVTLYKYFHGMNILLKGDGIPNDKLSLLLTSSTSGYSLDGEPAAGEYIFTAQPSADPEENREGTVYHCNVFKQTFPEDLQLKLMKEDRTLLEYNIGKEMKGYEDIGMQYDLSDVSVTIDFSLGKIWMKVNGWVISEEKTEVSF